MSNTEPLRQEVRDELESLAKKRPLLKLAKDWEIDRGTLASAHAGYPVRKATRFLIETKLKEEK